MPENPLGFASNAISEFHLGPWVFWTIFTLVLIIFAVVTAILVYHWRRFGLKNKTIAFAETIYFLVSGLLIYVSVISIFRLG